MIATGRKYGTSEKEPIIGYGMESKITTGMEFGMSPGMSTRINLAFGTTARPRG